VTSLVFKIREEIPQAITQVAQGAAFERSARRLGPEVIARRRGDRVRNGEGHEMTPQRMARDRDDAT